eukprot:6198072-Pleurochrysis_carterae.AAC.2
MVAARVSPRILTADCGAAKEMTPQLVEGLDRQRKRSSVRVLVGRSLKFFLRFGRKLAAWGR